MMCSPWHLCSRTISSHVRIGLIKFSYQGILPMQSGTHGKYLSSDQWAGQ